MFYAQGGLYSRNPTHSARQFAAKFLERALPYLRQVDGRDFTNQIFEALATRLAELTAGLDESTEQSGRFVDVAKFDIHACCERRRKQPLGLFGRRTPQNVRVLAGSCVEDFHCV